MDELNIKVKISPDSALWAPDTVKGLKRMVVRHLTIYLAGFNEKRHMFEIETDFKEENPRG